MTARQISHAREELCAAGLIAYSKPFYQVLSLEKPAARKDAIDDAFTYQAFSGEYIANILEQRSRILPEPGALHVTHRADLLELELPEPNLSIYDSDDDLNKGVTDNECS